MAWSSTATQIPWRYAPAGAENAVGADHVPVSHSGSDQQVECDAELSGHVLHEDLHLAAIALAPRSRVEPQETFHGTGVQRRNRQVAAARPYARVKTNEAIVPGL